MQNSETPADLTLPAIRYSFAFTSILFGVLPFTGVIPPIPTAQSELLTYVLSGVALLMLLGAPMVNRLAARALPGPDGLPIPPTPQHVMGGRLAMYALWEGSAIIGFACFVLSGNTFVSAFFAGAAAAAIIAYKPPF